MKTPFHQHISRNELGRDFIVGDIHANKGLLESALNKVAFDKRFDRVFCTGDLIDGGEDNQAVIDLLHQAWFFAIRGNHEQMLLNRFDYPPLHPFDDRKTQQQAARLHRDNGGEWFDKLTAAQQMMVYQRLSQLPVAITLEARHGRIGLVHAEVPQPFEDWMAFIDKIQTDPDVRHEALWSRWFIGDVYDFNRHAHLNPALDNRWVAQIGVTVHGHTRVNEPVVSGNQIWIDTAEQTGALTILNVADVFALIELIE